MSMLKKELICFGISVLLFLSVFSSLYYFYRDDIFLTVLMLTPAASVIITRVLTKEGFAGLHLKPNFKGNIKLYLAAYFGTPAAAFSGAVIYFMIFRSKWKPLMSRYAIEIGCKTNEEYFQNLAMMIPLAVLINPLMGLLQCFGEEFAWRGYLLPKLNMIFNYRTAVILNGIIWGLWQRTPHMGHFCNDAFYRYTGNNRIVFIYGNTVGLVSRGFPRRPKCYG